VGVAHYQLLNLVAVLDSDYVTLALTALYNADLAVKAQGGRPARLNGRVQLQPNPFSFLELLERRGGGQATQALEVPAPANVLATRMLQSNRLKNLSIHSAVARIKNYLMALNTFSNKKNAHLNKYLKAKTQRF
jgi:hypothetical protein